MKKIAFLLAAVLLCLTFILADGSWAAQSGNKAPKKVVITPEMTKKIEMVGNRMRFLTLDAVSEEVRVFLESIEWIELPSFFSPFDKIALERSEVPTHFELLQNYPNPFNLSTVIGYTLPEASEVRLEIFNLAGQRIVCPFEGHQPAGRHQITWDGTDDHGNVVATGVYFLRLTAGDFSSVKKMNLVK